LTCNSGSITAKFLFTPNDPVMTCGLRQKLCRYGIFQEALTGIFKKGRKGTLEFDFKIF
jgi:hypothetical protein